MEARLELRTNKQMDEQSKYYMPLDYSDQGHKNHIYLVHYPNC